MCFLALARESLSGYGYGDDVRGLLEILAQFGAIHLGVESSKSEGEDCHSSADRPENSGLMGFLWRAG